MRIFDYSSGGKPIAANTTQQFTNSDIPSNGVGAYFFGMTGVGNTLAAISRLRGKANGTTFMDCTPAQLRALIQRMSSGCIAYPSSTIVDSLAGAGVAAQFRRFSIPFCDLTQPTEDLQDLFQFPRNSQVTIEVQFGGGAVAGTIFCGWYESSVTPLGFPKFVGNAMNIPISQPSMKYPFNEDAIVKAVTLNTVGNGRTRIVIDGVQRYNMQGQAADSATVVADSMILESQQLANGMPENAAGTALAPNVVWDPTCIKLSQPRVAVQGRSYIELTTTASWGGTSNEAALYSQYVYSEFRGTRAAQLVYGSAAEQAAAGQVAQASAKAA